MKLREYHLEDYEEVVDLFYNTVHSVNAEDYTEEQLDAWAPEDKSLPKLDSRLLNSYAVVAEKDGIIVGFGNAEDTGYFDCLYTHKDYQRIGVATLIADSIEKYLYGKGIQIIAVDASVTAKPFFEKREYLVLQKESVERRGQTIAYFKMQKNLMNEHHPVFEKSDTIQK